MTGREIETLAARVDQLENREAIRDLGNAYHALGCQRDSAGMAELFAEDARVDYGAWGVVEGRAAIGEMFRRAIGDDEWVPFTLQFVHNHRFEVDGDRGHGRRYITCCLVHNDESYVCAAHFDDVYAKRDGRWLYQDVKLHVYFWVPLREGWAKAAVVSSHLEEARSHMGNSNGTSHA